MKTSYKTANLNKSLTCHEKVYFLSFWMTEREIKLKTVFLFVLKKPLMTTFQFTLHGTQASQT